MSKIVHNYIWGLTFKESMSVTFLGSLMSLSSLIRIPMHIPGHSGLLWVTILTFCCLTFRKVGSGTLAGIVAGFLAVVFCLGKDGPFVFLKYFLPGLSMDLLFMLIPYLATKWYLTAIVAAYAHWTKLLVNFIIGSILNVPQGFLIMGVQIATIDHLVFGFVAGSVAFIIYSRIKHIKSKLVL